MKFTIKKHVIKNKLRGGVKFSKVIKGAKTRSFEPSVDDTQIMADLFRNIETLRELSTNSSNSMVLVATLKPDRDIMLRSQCDLPQQDAVDCLENVDKGAPETQFCLKLAIIDDKRDIDLSPFDGNIKRPAKTAVVVNEVGKQYMWHGKLLCVNSNARIPDIITHRIMKQGEFNALIRHAGRLDKSTQDVIDWINAELAKDPNREVSIIAMEMLSDFVTVASLMIDSPHEYAHAMLHLAANTVVLAVKGDGAIPYDMSPSNAMWEKGKGTERLQMIDFDRVLNLSNKEDEVKVKAVFKKLCDECDNPFHSHPMSKEQLCAFFSCDEASLEPAFQREINFLKTDNDPRCSKLTHPRALEHTHRTLMMIAFIDFMMNRVNYNCYQCRFGSTMKIVYHGCYPGANTFYEFNKFLERCRPHVVPPNATNLEVVTQLTQELVKECPGESRCLLQGNAFRFRAPDPMEKASEAVATLAVPMSSSASKTQPRAYAQSALNKPPRKTTSNASTTSSAPVKSSVAKPPVKSSVAKPPVKSSVAKPPVKSSVAKPPVKSSVAKPPVKSSTAKIPKPNASSPMKSEQDEKGKQCKKDKEGKFSCSMMGGNRSRNRSCNRSRNRSRKYKY